MTLYITFETSSGETIAQMTSEDGNTIGSGGESEKSIVVVYRAYEKSQNTAVRLVFYDDHSLFLSEVKANGAGNVVSSDAGFTEWSGTAPTTEGAKLSFAVDESNPSTNWTVKKGINNILYLIADSDGSSDFDNGNYDDYLWPLPEKVVYSNSKGTIELHSDYTRDECWWISENGMFPDTEGAVLSFKEPDGKITEKCVIKKGTDGKLYLCAYKNKHDTEFGDDYEYYTLDGYYKAFTVENYQYFKVKQ